MSDRTQEEGRSYYTEREYKYIPSIHTGTNQIRMDKEWENKLLWATRVGDPIFDRTPPRPDGFGKPMLQLIYEDIHELIVPGTKGILQKVSGRIVNYQPPQDGWKYSIPFLITPVQHHLGIQSSAPGIYNVDLTINDPITSNITFQVGVHLMYYDQIVATTIESFTSKFNFMIGDYIPEWKFPRKAPEQDQVKSFVSITADFIKPDLSNIKIEGVEFNSSTTQKENEEPKWMALNPTDFKFSDGIMTFSLSYHKYYFQHGYPAWLRFKMTNTDTNMVEDVFLEATPLTYEGNGYIFPTTSVTLVADDTYAILEVIGVPAEGWKMTKIKWNFGLWAPYNSSGSANSFSDTYAQITIPRDKLEFYKYNLGNCQVFFEEIATGKTETWSSAYNVTPYAIW